MNLTEITKGKNKTEEEKVFQRRNFIEAKTNINLPNIGNFSIIPTQVAGKNCENMIGAAQLPMGVAGPIAIHFLNKKLNTPPLGANKEYFVPLATTEGALIASVSRGCKATHLAGGIITKIEKVGITRAPVFQVQDLTHAQALLNWVETNFQKIKTVANATDAYVKLLEIQPHLSGTFVFLRCIFDTCEAMGMNMATIATQAIVDYIKKELDIDCLSISGNLCTDKKPCWLNFIEGRGNKVWAEAIIPKEIVQSVLKTTPEKIVRVILSKTITGSQMSGSLGFNAHYANIIAALYIATGQDPAHVVEGSMGITSAHIDKHGDLYFSVYLPAIIVGTVGGGTSLATQQEALQILGLGTGKTGGSVEFAQIIAATVLAGELSLVAALAAGHLTQAHEELGRRKNNSKTNTSEPCPTNHNMHNATKTNIQTNKRETGDTSE